jgi:hypothetical protein
MPINLPSWPAERLIVEAVGTYNLRHPDSPVDAKTVEWSHLCAIILSFCRHELSGYTQALLEGADREKLRAAVHAAARAKYPWLRANTDPRKPESKEAPPDSRMLTRYSRRSADLITYKAQLLARMRELRGQLSRSQTDELKERVREIDALIASDLAWGQMAIKQAALTKDSAQKNGCELMMLRYKQPGYQFGGKDLLESYTKYLGFCCPECGQRVRRTKRPIDLGSGIKLSALSCHCTSILVNRIMSYPRASTWTRLVTEEEQTS